ncbi:THAP domain-containing protein 1-like [Orussus abietinus]|uniref:THAP domain-containing protein 1-like n=1 Tax=Orussus abietinus TaxID=222816 RepID=UPI000C715E7C|nr:THAP domain-containing protein 1-like [Orussus abietinus]
MGRRCVVPNCNAKSNKSSSLSFFQFPKDLEMQKKWLSAINVENFESIKFSTASCICSQHFTKDSFAPKQFGKARELKKGVVPQLNIFSTEVRNCTFIQMPPCVSKEKLQNTTVMMNQQIFNQPKREVLEETSSTDQNVTYITSLMPTKRKYFEGDFNIVDMDYPERARLYFQAARNKISNLQKRLQVCRKRCKRLSAKNDSCENYRNALVSSYLR